MTNKTPQSVKMAIEAVARLKKRLSAAYIDDTAGINVFDKTAENSDIQTILTALQSLDEKGGIVMPESEDFPNEVWLANGRANLHQVKTRSKLSMMKYYRADYTPPATRAPDTVGDGWQPIEQPPETDEIILVVWPEGAIRMARYLNGDYWFEASGGKHMVNKIGFTHWQPLPQPPAADTPHIEGLDEAIAFQEGFRPPVGSFENIVLQAARAYQSGQTAQPTVAEEDVEDMITELEAHVYEEFLGVTDRDIDTAGDTVELVARYLAATYPDGVKIKRKD